MKKETGALFVFILALIVFASVAEAEPSGVSITSNSTNYGRTSSPGNRTDPGGSITTMVLDAVQQNTQWKAYIGNISGSLKLDDSSGSTIFEWALENAAITGEIYASRSNSVTWGSTACSTLGTITGEQTALSINASASDSIQNTFNMSVHPGFVVAGLSIGANSCSYATSTYVNSARQAQASADFPIILLHDATNLIYTTILNSDTVGYNGQTYDFQMIVADIPTTAATTYYFYAELGS